MKRILITGSNKGIGLATVKKIVEAHQGKIWIDPRNLEGTRFICELPE